MKWNHAISDFKDYLKIERGLSENSISSYENDLKKLKSFLNKNIKQISPLDVEADHIKEFVYYISKEEHTVDTSGFNNSFECKRASKKMVNNYGRRSIMLS